MSFSAFDRAMEDTLLALNTGHWRTRDGVVIDRAKGKSYIVHPAWREKLDEVARCIEKVREEFHRAVGFDEMLYRLRYHRPNRITHEMEMMMERRFRDDLPFGSGMNEKRDEAIKILNTILEEIGHPPLKTMEEW